MMLPVAADAMYRAARFGSNSEIVRLYSLGVGVDCADSAGNRPIHGAAQEGFLTTMQLLVDLGANPNVSNVSGNTPLHVATLHNKLCAMNVLVRCYKLNVNARNTHGDTALFIASELCLNDAYIAAYKGHDTTVRLLVQLGSSPNARNNHGDTPVLIAAREAHDSTIRLLVSELGASCNPVNNSGITPVAIAAYNGHESTVRLLAELGADFDLLPAGPTKELLVDMGHHGIAAYMEDVRAVNSAARLSRVDVLQLRVALQSLTPVRQWYQLLSVRAREDLQGWVRDCLVDMLACHVALSDDEPRALSTSENDIACDMIASDDQKRNAEAQGSPCASASPARSSSALRALFCHSGLPHVSALIASFVTFGHPRVHASVRELNAAYMRWRRCVGI